MTLFSIITITKDNRDGFRRTGESIEAQTFDGREWIVIDGNVEPDDGIYDAMNKGIERAQGEYIIFMNAGDAFACANTLQKIADAIGEKRPGFLYGDALEDGQLKPARPYRAIAQGMHTHHQAMLYKRDIIGNLRYDTRYRIAADYKFTVQMIARAKHCLHLHFPVCHFEPGGISQRHARLGRREQAAIRRELRLCSPFASRLIESAQAASHMLKTHSPMIYWEIRKRLKASRA